MQVFQLESNQGIGRGGSRRYKCPRAMATALAMESAPAFQPASIATIVDVPDQALAPLDDSQMREDHRFGQVHRQRRRQQVPRAPRRCFTSFDTSALTTPPRPDNMQLHQACAFSTNDSAPFSSCSFRVAPGDEEIATCSTIDLKDSKSWRSDLSEDGDSSLSSTSWSSGTLVWAKFSRSPWWPAQVVDDRSAGGAPDPKLEVLVRFFGNYNYAWVDATTCLSKFDMNFQERSQVVTKAFQKGLKEAVEYRNHRKLPLKWRNTSYKQEEWQTPQENGKDSSEDESERTTSTRRRKPKVLYEDEERLHNKPKRNLRRKRIMRELGLVAPYGSPFAYGGSV